MTYYHFNLLVTSLPYMSDDTRSLTDETQSVEVKDLPIKQ